MRYVNIYTVILKETDPTTGYIEQILKRCGFTLEDSRQGWVLWVYGLPTELSLKLTYKDNAMRYSVSCTVGQAEELPYEINLIKMQRYFSRLRDRIPSVPDNNFLRKETKLLLRELE